MNTEFTSESGFSVVYGAVPALRYTCCLITAKQDALYRYAYIGNRYKGRIGEP